MSVYSRFKKSPEGFRQLVELLESTPVVRRQKMIDVGNQEDPAYTALALQYTLNFEDVLGLPDLELAELMAKAPPKITAIAIRSASEDTKTRFVRNSKPDVGAAIRDYMNIDAGPREMGGAQLKLIEITRQLERKGLIHTKRIPERV